MTVESILAKLEAVKSAVNDVVTEVNAEVHRVQGNVPDDKQPPATPVVEETETASIEPSGYNSGAAEDDPNAAPVPGPVADPPNTDERPEPEPAAYNSGAAEDSPSPEPVTEPLTETGTTAVTEAVPVDPT